MCVCVGVCAYVCGQLWSSEGGSQIPWSCGQCELPDMGTENQSLQCLSQLWLIREVALPF